MKKALKMADEYFEEVFVSLMMGYFVTVTILQIVFRFIIKKPAAWTEETAKYSFIWMTFVGSSLVAKLKTHIRVDMLESKLKGPGKEALNLFCQGVFLLFGAATALIGVQMCLSLLSRPQLSPVLKIPMQYIYAALPVGMGLMSMRIIRNIFRQIKGRGAGGKGLNLPDREDI
jgi:TRAP-type C4-dicarboxylate transport system permease small subunit